MSQAKLIAETTPQLFTLEPMTEHDLLEVVEIEEASGLSRWGYDVYMAELFRLEAIMLVARRAEIELSANEQLQGFIAARLMADELSINNIAVRTASRRRGIGGALLLAAFNLAARRNVNTAILEVRATNSSAQALYLRYGFQIVGRRENYYGNPPEDALVMTAAINLTRET